MSQPARTASTARSAGLQVLTWAAAEMSSVMMRPPSGLQETTLTQRRSRPWRLRTSSPVAAAQTRGPAESKAEMETRESGPPHRPTIAPTGPQRV